MTKTSKLRIAILISIFIITPLGFLSNLYKGPAHEWLNNSLGGAFYEIFWCLIVYLIFPKTDVIKIALIVYLSTCFLEILQLWHPPFLEIIRHNYIGRIVIGNRFNLFDFPYYVFGSLGGWFWMMRLRKKYFETQV